jgi:DNA repair protein RadC
LLALRFRFEKYATAFFLVRKRRTSKKRPGNLVSLFLGARPSEALDSVEHLGLILGDQEKAALLLQHFGSIALLARASVHELLPFVTRSKALRLVSSLRLAAVVLREERQQLTIDSPLAIADLCCEMRFMDREILRAVLLNAKQHLIKSARSAKAA